MLMSKSTNEDVFNLEFIHNGLKNNLKGITNIVFVSLLKYKSELPTKGSEIHTIYGLDNSITCLLLITGE